MKNFYSSGDVIPFANSGSAIDSGDVVAIGNGVGVAVTDIGAGNTGSVALCGVFLVDKTTSQAWAQGQQLFYVESTGKLSTAGSGNIPAGVAFLAAGSNDATGYLAIRESAAQQAANVATVTAGTPACAGGSSPTAGNVDTAIGAAIGPLTTGINAILTALKNAGIMAAA